MCVMSVVTDSALKQWGPIQGWPQQTAVDMLMILKRLDEIDKKLAAKECVEPTKDMVFKQLEERIARLEKSIETAS